MNHSEAWPITSITISEITCYREQAIVVMQVGYAGDKTFDLFDQLISAKPSVGSGNNISCISSAIAATDAWMVHKASGVGGKFRLGDLETGGGPISCYWRPITLVNCVSHTSSFYWHTQGGQSLLYPPLFFQTA